MTLKTILIKCPECGKEQPYNIEAETLEEHVTVMGRSLTTDKFRCSNYYCNKVPPIGDWIKASSHLKYIKKD